MNLYEGKEKRAFFLILGTGDTLLDYTKTRLDFPYMVRDLQTGIAGIGSGQINQLRYKIFIIKHHTKWFYIDLFKAKNCIIGMARAKRHYIPGQIWMSPEFRYSNSYHFKI